MERAVQTPTHEAHPAYVTQDLVPRLLARVLQSRGRRRDVRPVGREAPSTKRQRPVPE
jgi:hypothetical protein